MEPYPNQELHQKRIEALTSLLQKVVNHQQKDRVTIADKLINLIEESDMPEHSKEEEIFIINKILFNQKNTEKSCNCSIL